MDIVSLALGLASGALGGNVAGKLMNSSMGTMGRSVTGIVGGALLSFVSSKFLGVGVADPTAGASLNVGSIVSGLVSGGIGGGLLTAILGAVTGKR